MTYIIVEESTVAELDLEVDFVDASLLNVNGSTTPLIQKEYIKSVCRKLKQLKFSSLYK